MPTRLVNSSSMKSIDSRVESWTGPSLLGTCSEGVRIFGTSKMISYFITSSIISVMYSENSSSSNATKSFLMSEIKFGRVLKFRNDFKGEIANIVFIESIIRSVNSFPSLAFNIVIIILYFLPITEIFF